MTINKKELLEKRKSVIESREYVLEMILEATRLGVISEETFSDALSTLTKSGELINNIDSLIELEEFIEELKV